MLQHLHFFYVVIRAATKLLYSGSCIFFRESSTIVITKYSRMTHLQFDKDDEVLYSASYIYEAHRLPIGKHLSKQSI